MPLPPLLTRIRGIRSPIPAGYVVGRAVGSKSGQLIPISQLANGPGGVAGGGVPPGGSTGFQPLPTLASGDVLGNAGASPAIAVDTAITALLDRAFGSTEGELLQRGSSAWGVLAPGTVNQVLASGGASALNSWAGLSALLDTVFGSTEGELLQRGSSAWQVLAAGTANQVLASGGAAALNSWAGLSALLDSVFGSTEGEILQRGASLWQVLAAGTAGQVLTSGGAAALNTWGAGFKLTNQGAWVGTIAYNPGDVVQFDGSSYLNFAAVTAPTGSPATWNPADKGASITLTSGNLVATAASSAASGVRSTLSKTTGKFYFEAVGASASNNFTGIGFANASAVVSGLASTANYAIGFNIGSIFVNGSSLGSWPGSPITHGGFAIDLDAQLAWWCTDVTASPQSWNNSTSNSPGGAGGISTAGLGGAGTGVFIAAIIQTSSEAFTLITSPGSYAHAAPAGFGPWTSASSNTSPDQDDAHWLSQGNVSTVDSNFTITAGGQLQLHTIASGDVLGVSGGSTAEPTAATMTAMLDRAFGSTEGQILQRGSSAWQILAPGTSGQLLKSGGAAALNAWGADAFANVTGQVTLAQLPSIATAKMLANISGATATPTAVAMAPNTSTGAAQANVSTSSTTFVMAGFAQAITAARSGTGLLFFTTACSSTVVGEISFQMRVGTGTAPVAGAAGTGTQIGSGAAPEFSATSQIYDVTLVGLLNGLTVGTTYWLDVAFEVVSGVANSAQLSNNNIFALEF